MVIERRHAQGGKNSAAAYSDCERYRYALTREWDPAGPRINFLLLNPSRATEVQNDPTVERCERRAKALGYGAFRVTNLFGLRETNPGLMRNAPDPVGPDNDAAIAEAAGWADLVLCGWGHHGAHLGRGASVAQWLRDQDVALWSLGLTRDGHPRHPLYIAYAVAPTPWN